MRFVTYGLVDPRSGRLRYVGQTSNLDQRLQVHNYGDRATPTYDLARELRHLGLRWVLIIFGEFEDRIDARRLERMLVLTLPGLLNSREPTALISQRKHPITAHDGDLLVASIDAAPAAHDQRELMQKRRAKLKGKADAAD